MSALTTIDPHDRFAALSNRLTEGPMPARTVSVALGTRERFVRRQHRISANLNRDDLLALARLCEPALARPTRPQIAQALKVWKGCVRPSDFSDPEQYAENFAVVLSSYPVAAIAALSDLSRADHIVRTKSRFTPTIGDVCAWLDGITEPYRKALLRVRTYVDALDALDRDRADPDFLNEFHEEDR